jgi:polar amino acid transport system substrate-binding protein
MGGTVAGWRGRRLLGGLLAATVMLGNAQAAQTLDDIQWISEEYAPYNYTQDGVPTGISVDVLQHIWERLDIQRGVTDIRVLPWARGYRIAQDDPNTCLFLTTVTEPRRELFQFVEPVVDVSIAIVGPAANEARADIASVEDLDPLTIGVVRDDIGEHLLEHLGATSAIVRTDSPHILVRMLRGGRFDAIAYDSHVTRWNMAQENIDPADYADLFVLSHGVMGYACHRDMDPALIDQLQGALDELLADGTVDRIIRQYRER